MLKYLLKTLISFIRIINNFYNQIVKSTAIISYFTRYHARSDILTWKFYSDFKKSNYYYHEDLSIRLLSYIQ